MWLRSVGRSAGGWAQLGRVGIWESLCLQLVLEPLPCDVASAHGVSIRVARLFIWQLRILRGQKQNPRPSFKF